jgi:hypothetical protein
MNSLIGIPMVRAKAVGEKNRRGRIAHRRLLVVLKVNRNRGSNLDPLAAVIIFDCPIIAA